MIKLLFPDGVLEQAMEDHTEIVTAYFKENERFHQIDDWIKCVSKGSFNFELILDSDVKTLRLAMETIGEIETFPEFIDKMRNDYDRFSGNKLKGNYGAISLLKKLNVGVCPYCNINGIRNYFREEGERRIAQIDHHFPQSKYPYLALSFYNLTPSCSNCNGIKRAQDLSISPYDEEKLDELARFTYYLDKSIEDFKIHVTVRDERLKKNFRVLGIPGRYDHKSDDLKELIEKIRGRAENQKDWMKYHDSWLLRFKDLIPSYCDLKKMQNIEYSKFFRDILHEIYDYNPDTDMASEAPNLPKTG